MRRAGIDVGGTKLLGVLLDGSGSVLNEIRRPTPVGADALIDGLAALAGELGSWDSLGIGLPGLVTRDGVVRSSPHLPGVHDVPVSALLARRLDRQVSADNDATCAAVGEWQFGAGRGVDDLVVVTLGTGIGTVLGGALIWVLGRWSFIHLPGDVYFIETLPVRPEGMDFTAVILAALVL